MDRRPQSDRPRSAPIGTRKAKALREDRHRGTNAGVTTGLGMAAAGGDAAQAWRDIRANPEIQYAPVDLPEAAPPPDWLTRLLELLDQLFAPVAGLIAAHWPVVWPVLAVLGGLLALYVLARLVTPDLLRRRRRVEADEAVWTPEASAALALLEEADRLAASGRYGEATHLLLTRSVGQIAALRPELIDPSSTAREIAALPALPEPAARAFAIIAERVERSLFALRSLSAEDWQAARAAYADFARIAERRLAA